MTPPKRIQRKRTKGWRMPEGAVYVGRPSMWGNYTSSQTAAEHDEWITGDSFGARYVRSMAKRDLRGKDLACYCPLNQPCHADTLLRIANE